MVWLGNEIEENEGFDFGLWYHAFLKYNVDLYDKIALVNDSCILFKSLDDFILTKKLDSNIAIVEAEIWEFTVNLWGDSVEKNLKIFIEFWEKYQNKEINKIILNIKKSKLFL